MPRRSRRIAQVEVVEPFADINPLENHGARNETNGVTISHNATVNCEKKYTSFEPNLQVNLMSKEAIHIVKTQNDTQYLENYIVSFLLMSAKEGI